jgi:hypothetical protein
VQENWHFMMVELDSVVQKLLRVAILRQSEVDYDTSDGLQAALQSGVTAEFGM